MLSVEELEDGYLFVLAPEAGGDREISDLVALESRCCAFLEFSVETGKGATRLAIRGGEGAKAFLEAEFVRGSTRGGT